jgi:hypothetical protein
LYFTSELFSPLSISKWLNLFWLSFVCRLASQFLSFLKIQFEKAYLFYEFLSFRNSFVSILMLISQFLSFLKLFLFTFSVSTVLWISKFSWEILLFLFQCAWDEDTSDAWECLLIVILGSMRRGMNGHGG